MQRYVFSLRPFYSTNFWYSTFILFLLFILDISQFGKTVVVRLLIVQKMLLKLEKLNKTKMT